MHLEFCEPVFRKNNIFHLNALDFKFLRMVFDEIKKNDPDEENQDEVNLFKTLVFYLIYPNNKQESPFDLVIENNSPKCINIMLEMLISVPEYRVSSFMRKHFPTIFPMNLPIFEEFLDSCLFNNIPMNNI